MELTFDKAIELLEITNITKVEIEKMPQLEKAARKRWHPDNVSHLNNPTLIEEYTLNFQQIGPACEMITEYLDGNYHAGEAFIGKSQPMYDEPEEIIRNNAYEMQSELKNVWDFVKKNNYKHRVKEIILSDGYKLKDLLKEDFEEDFASLSVISFFYGVMTFGLIAAIGAMISPLFGSLIGIFVLIQALACVLGFSPLSRFWMPDSLKNIVAKLIDVGLGIYNWADSKAQSSSNILIHFLVRLPALIAKLVKYIILFPLYEIAKAVVGDKVVGVVKQDVNYYADMADWYIEEIMNNNPLEMESDDLFNLSYLYSELLDIKKEPVFYTQIQTE